MGSLRATFAGLFLMTIRISKSQGICRNFTMKLSRIKLKTTLGVPLNLNILPKTYKSVEDSL